jgi:hypothetical protein
MSATEKAASAPRPISPRIADSELVKSKPRLAAFTAGLFLVPLGIIARAGW